MKLSVVLQHLLVFISALALTRAQTASAPTTLAETSTDSPGVTTMTTSTVPSVLAGTSAQPWTAPAIFYPFGSAAGDTEHYEFGSENHYSVGLSTPFTFFGHTYNNIYVIYNGLLTFTITSTSGPNYSPFRGTEDFIAALWNDFDDYYNGVLSYQQYTNGSVLGRATQDVNQYFSPVNFNASWVFVVTWKYGSQSNPEILFQAVLISGGNQSYFLMNYGDCAVLFEAVEAGYDTINSISNFTIPDSTNGNYRNLKNTSNVNVPGRWAFNAWAAPAIFYPFGSAVGDTEHSETGSESYSSVGLSTPFTFFGHTYNNIYVNYNGLLTFNMHVTSGPYYNPSRGTEDVIAALWNDFDDDFSGLFSYQQYTNGSVLDRATQDINQYFSPGNFNASWVFVVTWRYSLQPNPAILFQVVLVSDGARSFFLMNYGNCAVLYGQVEAGYDTINSLSNFVIPDSTNGNYQNLKNTSNVNVPGRWAFNANNGSAFTTTTSAVPSAVTTTTSTVPSVLATTSAQPWTAPAIFYPFGSAAGDTEQLLNYGEGSYSVGLSTPFTFFGHTYNNIYVIYNGLLTFTITSTSGPNYSPFRGTEDFIAALWNDFDDYYNGVLSYKQYTNGSVLGRATQDVNQYFSTVNFRASWVFVVTWKYGSLPNPAILFQAVLISGGGQSYFLLNYGDCAVLFEAVEAGYDTINSISNFTIPDSTNGNYRNLKNTSNVNVPGRWAFNAWAAPAIFYPFGSAVGDTEHLETGSESYSSVGLSTPFTFFGHTYNNIYVNYNGLLTFNMRSMSGPYYNPSRGTEDVIAALWNDFDDDFSGLFSYQQYTNGSVLDRATQDINQYFSPGNFNASWVFVVTWRYNLQPNPAILFQVVLVSDGARSFFLMNYGNCAVLYGQVEAGYDTINSLSNFVIPDSTNGNYQNLKNTSNVNVPGRWAFNANNGSAFTTTTSAVPSVSTTSAQPWTAPAIFYPFGSAAGDTEHYETGSENYYFVGLSTPFTFFGHTYNNIYVNYNGLLTFNMHFTSGPYYNPIRGTEDAIAALWNDFDDYYNGVLSYKQYTNGSVLGRATQDVNQYFSTVNFRASWVFVVTWKYGSLPNPAILFQAVLISGGGQSYFLLNYGDCAVLYETVGAGYDTINSISYFVIPDSTNGNYRNLKSTSNVNVPGRWAFNAWAAPAIFYPFGSAVGDTEHLETGSENYYSVGLSTPFTFFGHTYNNIYVNYNGLLTFNMHSMSGPYYNPSRGTEDVIAALWNDFDDGYSGLFSYQQYTNGSVLDRATQNINQYFSPDNFNASWVFVVTWRYNLQPNPAILFQVVLVSDGARSFFLMNYGNCAVLYGQVEAGYDTINSVSNFVIPDSTNGNYQNLKNTSNVNVPGRWAFISSKGLENVIGAQLRVTSFSDLTQSENLEAVLQQIKQVLVSRGLSNNFQIKKRNVKKIKP